MKLISIRNFQAKQCQEQGTYNVVRLSLLALSRPFCHPPHADAVTSVENIQLLERDLGLRALGIHEFGAACEGRSDEVQWRVIAAVDDAGNGGGVVHEVWGQGCERKFIGVVLDELLEDAGRGVGIIG